MTELFRDDFTRADSDTVGGNWVETTNDWDIVSNAVRASAVSSTESLLVNTSTLGQPNYRVTATITGTASLWGSSRGIGVVARLTSSNTYYMVWMDGTDTSIKIFSVITGTFTVLIAQSISIPSDPFTLAIEMRGYRIGAWLNGVEVISAVDTQISVTEGDFGLRTFNSNAFPSHLVESVVVEDLASTQQEVLTPNGLTSTLNGSITNSATSLVIQTADADDWPAEGTYRAVLWDDPSSGPWELVKVTGGQGTATLTVERAAEAYHGTQTAQAWASGTGIAVVLTQGHLDKALMVVPVYEEFQPANGSTIVTLGAAPESLMMVARQGVVQSIIAGHFAVYADKLTFSSAFNGSDRLVVSYTIRGLP